MLGPWLPGVKVKHVGLGSSSFPTTTCLYAAWRPFLLAPGRVLLVGLSSILYPHSQVLVYFW